ncbi:CRASP family complement regulator-acquiring lipoprotein [Borrelia hermsii]|uniref:CRASP family complement regulator-acquiring lipoprotein n=1 Tax=Borrelia hermsii TaxID=140 RepID=UPI00046CC67B|nr:CRASP family complement regulator-acquiring lipoprotein [Borrelia hermsii]
MKYKIFIILIITGLFLPLLTLISCNSEPEKTEGVKLNANIPDPRKPDLPKPGNPATADQQDEAKKQFIVNDLIAFIIPRIKDNIDTHNDTTWDEVAQKYNIQASDQLFGVTQYTDAQGNKKLYNLQDDKSKTARREMYLGLDYKKNYIKAFGALANKMIATKNVQMKTELANMVKKIRQYARAFYLTAFNTLINKKDKLLKLDLSDLQTLKAKFWGISSTYRDISFHLSSIYNDYDKDIEVGTASPKKNQLQTTATAEEIQKYLKDKFNPIESYFNTIIKEATEIAGILNKIQ